MFEENDIKKMVKDVLTDILANQQGAPVAAPAAETSSASNNDGGAPVADSGHTIPDGKPHPELVNIEDGFIPDIAISTKEEFFVPHPADQQGYMDMKQHTVARLGIWRAGPRYNTWSQLHFRADHATAQDAVFTDIDDDFAKENGFIAGQTLCHNKDEFLTRPDWGRKLNDETRELYDKELPKGQKVTLMVGDGLSTSAMVNIKDVVPAIKQGLKGYGIDVGPIPFVKYCRVGAMDDLGELIDSDVICVLIGERPGLATGESMSAYMAYKPNSERPESWRTVVSNIYSGGTPPAEAGAHIATVIKRILDEKVSGTDLVK